MTLRLSQLDQWTREQSSEFRGESYPPEVQAAWDQNMAEADQLRGKLSELATRDDHLRALARSGGGNVESGDGRRVSDQGDPWAGGRQGILQYLNPESRQSLRDRARG